ncbi:hypothetical protein GQR36_25520 [Enterococcus termitis]
MYKDFDEYKANGWNSHTNIRVKCFEEDVKKGCIKREEKINNARLLSLVTGTLSAIVILYVSLAGVLTLPYAPEVEKIGGILAVFVNAMFATWTGYKVGGDNAESNNT